MKNMKVNLVLSALVLLHTGCDPGGPFSAFDYIPPTDDHDAAAPDGAPDGIAPNGDAGDSDAGDSGRDQSDSSQIRGDSSTGGAPGTTSGAGGKYKTADDACLGVTHSNGFGQNWIDCVPIGTHTEVQAFRACRAWCAVNDCAGDCYSGPMCDMPLVLAQIGISGPSVVAVGWTWQKPFDGNVVRIDSVKQTCSPAGSWN